MITAIIMMFVVGAVLGMILGIASNVFKVEVDERVEKVTAMLPGYNCGSCGFAGCSGMAEAMVAGEVATASACKPSKPDARAKIVEYLTTTPGPDGNTINIKA